METSLCVNAHLRPLLPGSMAASCDDIRSEIPNPMQKNNKKRDLVVCAKNGKVADPKEEKRQQKAELEKQFIFCNGGSRCSCNPHNGSCPMLMFKQCEFCHKVQKSICNQSNCKNRRAAALHVV